jgi:2-methylisocitrate lyase-like PEP mutase family enzyme
MNKRIQFKALHQQHELLFLANAWDLLSALVLEQCGFKALGTTSWGVANAMGYKDGENILFGDLAMLTKRIISAVDIPVTVDIESGYSNNIKTVADNALRIADLGAAGINIEDSLKDGSGLIDASKQNKIIENIRNQLDNNGFSDFFINARTDTYFLSESPFEETISRANKYTESGANGIFVPGLAQEGDIKKIVESINVPLNLMSLPHLTDVESLNNLGVKRFSIGNSLSDATTAFIEQQSQQIFTNKNTKSLYDHGGIKTVFA